MCQMLLLPLLPPPPQHIDLQMLCEELEAAYLTGYLNRYKSPLAHYAFRIVRLSDRARLDDRFIIALAGVETGYGKHLGWGPYNAWNNVKHKTAKTYCGSWEEAISGVIDLLSHIPYTLHQSTVKIYSLYEEGDVNKSAPGQRTLDIIYGRQMGGNLDDIRVP
jgi:hypothetical protein